MTIAPPNLSYRGKTAASITVRHDEPVNFVAPSTAWVKTVINVVGSKGDAVQETVTTPGGVELEIGPLAGEQTYTVTAVAVSDADEVSLPTAAFRKFVSTNPNTDAFGHFVERQLPSVDETPVLSHEAVARFLDMIGFELSDGEKTVVGNNTFWDVAPHEAFATAAGDVDPPDHILVLCQNEPIAYPFKSNYTHKVDALVSVAVAGGNRDMAGVDAARLYRFFQQRAYVQFVVCGFAAHSVEPLGEPSLVGVEDNGLSVYQFRLMVRAVRLDLKD